MLHPPVLCDDWLAPGPAGAAAGGVCGVGVLHVAVAGDAAGCGAAVAQPVVRGHKVEPVAAGLCGAPHHVQAPAGEDKRGAGTWQVEEGAGK